MFQENNHFNTKFIKQSRNLGRATWTVLNYELGKSSFSYNSIVMSIQKETIENPKDVERKLNEYFVSIGKSINCASVS